MAIARDDLLEWFNYDPDTGAFTWRKRPARSSAGRRVGDPAGSLQAGIKRRVLWLRRKRMYAARAAYVMVHGDIPKTALVDHIDGDTLNDRIDNLRLASKAQNTWNRIQKNGSAYALGVAKDRRGRFKARVQLPDGKKLNLGTWETEQEAHACYMAAAAVLHGEFWIGARTPEPLG